ncbi:pyridoxine 5'-phosphate synthase, partial [Vibrio parahaemolyticus]
KTKPEFVCLVPEKREELTTEGGLDVVGQLEKVKAATQKLTEAGIKVSLFIDADRQQIEAAKQCGAPFIELHTGHYADAETEEEQQAELKKIAAGASYADDLGIIVNAGHGLTYHNVAPIAALPEIYELNIGHSIIGRAVFDGLEKSVAEMKALMIAARK